MPPLPDYLQECRLKPRLPYSSLKSWEQIKETVGVTFEKMSVHSYIVVHVSPSHLQSFLEMKEKHVSLIIAILAGGEVSLTSFFKGRHTRKRSRIQISRGWCLCYVRPSFILN